MDWPANNILLLLLVAQDATTLEELILAQNDSVVCETHYLLSSAWP